MTTTTGTTMAPAPAQLVSVTDAGPGYRAECSCGWASDRFDTLDLADLAGVEHPAEAVGPTDGMDRLMSDLLDLQDDLAAVVMWLAENWSVHLPELGWYSRNGSGGRSVPAVKVYGCGSLDEVAEAAALLGVVPTDDPTPNTYGYRLRRAVRRFGRVDVEVIATLDETTGNTP